LDAQERQQRREVVVDVEEVLQRVDELDVVGDAVARDEAVVGRRVETLLSGLVRVLTVLESCLPPSDLTHGTRPSDVDACARRAEFVRDVARRGDHVAAAAEARVAVTGVVVHSGRAARGRLVVGVEGALRRAGVALGGLLAGGEGVRGGVADEGESEDSGERH
jgi:hypothetical protein